MNTGQLKGLIFDIQGHSVHDGPGTRTLVFLDGCPLRCTWCSNPEGQLLRQRMMFKKQFCANCPRRCIEACPKGAIETLPEAKPLVIIQHDLCDQCSSFDCVSVCYMRALQVSGKYYTVDELMRVLNRDRSFWGTDGGVTLSGGEPLLQKDFIVALLNKCNDSYISACVETSAHVPQKTIEEILPYLQWMFVDIKHMDTKKHAEGTGVGNELILSNIRYIAKSGWPGRLIIRMPAIPGFNNTIENAEATADFMKEVGLKEINLLPFHRLGASKHEQLGSTYAYADQPAMAPSTLEPLARVYATKGISCSLSSDTPF